MNSGSCSQMRTPCKCAIVALACELRQLIGLVLVDFQVRLLDGQVKFVGKIFEEILMTKVW